LVAKNFKLAENAKIIKGCTNAKHASRKLLLLNGKVRPLNNARQHDKKRHFGKLIALTQIGIAKVTLRKKVVI
jgi:hypothetical protein